LNLAIKGWVREGDHVICTAVEHNSVRRPLEYVKAVRRASVTYVETDETGMLNLDRLAEAIRPNTRLIVCTHSSNLLGSILPIAEIASLARSRGIRLLVDAAQTAGTVPIDVGRMGIDMLAFPGHKGLLGPQGTGGLYITPEIELEPLLHGGTGSQSEVAEQPSVRPDRYEAGTPNTPGIAGLNVGVHYVLQETVERIRSREWALTQRMMDGLRGIPGLRLLGPPPEVARTGIISFTLDWMDAARTAFVLDRDYGIAVRAGYHCTPLAHLCAGTFGTGAVRASLGCFTTEDEVDALIQAVRDLKKNAHHPS
jgi:cysteine desulfurase family protein